MTERFSNRQSLLDAATVLAARRAIDKEIAQLVADPFDQAAADRLQNAVGENAERAQEALERLGHVADLRAPWEAAPGESQKSPGTDSVDEEAPPAPNPYRTTATSHEDVS